MDFPTASLGPKMQACTERQRKFVWAYLLNGGKDATQAARDAGCPDPGKHSSSIRVRGHELLHNPKVREAMKEVALAEFDGLFLPAVLAVKGLLAKPDHPDHVKTALSLLSRLGLSERTGVDVHMSAEVTVSHTDAALEALRHYLELRVPREKLEQIFGFSGLSRYEKMLAEQDAKAPKLIEHEPAGE